MDPQDGSLAWISFRKSYILSFHNNKIIHSLIRFEGLHKLYYRETATITPGLNLVLVGSGKCSDSRRIGV